MSEVCYDCGEEIIFRIGYYGPYPIHVNGGGCRGGSTVSRSPSYQRGYGGWTRQDAELAVKVVRRESSFYSYSGSMRSLAAELGYSLLFPVTCRYCGVDVYLFADPNGGFAIFDEVGIPWPKHQCIGVRPEVRSYAVRGAAHSSGYRLPVPAGLPAEAPTAGQELVGVVVQTAVAQDSNAYVYDGRKLWRLIIRPAQPLGTLLRGRIQIERCLPALLRFEILSPSVAESKLVVPPPPLQQVGEDAALTTAEPQREPISDLQLDAGILRSKAPTLAQYVDCAVDARLNGQAFTTFCILSHLACVKSDVLPALVKARYVALALEAISGYRLEPLVAALASRLTRATISALDVAQQSELKRLSDVGRLRTKLESRERILGAVAKCQRIEESFQLFLDRTYFETKSTIAAIARGVSGALQAS